MALSKSVMAIAQIEEDIPQDFKLYDLSQFLGVLSLLSEPELIFDNDKYVTIKDGNRTVRYGLCSDAIKLVVPPRDKQPSFKSVDVQFELTKEDLTSLLKAAYLLSVKNIVVEGNGQHIHLYATDAEEISSNNMSLKVGETDKIFRVIFDIDILNIMQDSYDVSISRSKLSKFSSKDRELIYWITADKKSTFED